ncbi:hypothetical protein FZC79_10530 [Rossellomorea vietnamensis]|uniref:Uncharacterized protein n=1 Tax=Rossellomorea vietnamensis TaxID=218284 RepID=A0A5D4KE61_9BACI|nr:hypothetical protein [Rossellomorea vietnamensis]TYR75594.1 hypothetical protein FZC79_10530 [Rossellomorea vietnamensis]
MKYNIEAIVEIAGVKARWNDYGYKDKVESGHRLIRRIRRETGNRPLEIIKVTADDEDITEEVIEIEKGPRI